MGVWRWAVGLFVVALFAAACGDTESTPGIAVSDVGDTTPTSAAEGAAEDGETEPADTSDAGDEQSVDSQPADDDSGVATASTATDSGSDAKALAARTIGDLSSADEAPGLDRADVAEAVFDMPNDGDITEAFGVDRWTFDASAGQILAIDVLAIDHGCRQDMTLVLVAPDGTRGEADWVGNGGCEVHGPYELDVDGTYGIEFVGGDGAVISDNTGAYRFIPTFLTERDVADAVFDNVNDGEITELFGVDRWLFNGTEGDLLTIEVLAIDHGCRQDLTMVIEDSFGEREELDWVGNGGCEAHGPYELERTGSYALEFYGGSGAVIDDNTGAYRFVPSFLTERDESPAAAGELLNGEITQLFGVDRWTFDGSAGDLLTIEIIGIDHGCRQDLTLTVEDPFGERDEVGWIGNGRCQAHGPFELERDGTYVMEFSGGSGAVISDNTGAYSFTYSLG